MWRRTRTIQPLFTLKIIMILIIISVYDVKHWRYEEETTRTAEKHQIGDQDGPLKIKKVQDSLL